jgi:hypothetical protein
MSTPSSHTLRLGDLFDSLRGGLHFLWKGYRQWLWLSLISVGLAIGFYFWQRPSYEARVSFILEEKSSGLSGGLSGIASSLGVDVSALSGGGNLFSGDNILEILTARKILTDVLLSKVDSTKGDRSASLMDLYFSFAHLTGGKRDLDTFYFGYTHDPLLRSRTHDSLMGLACERLIKKQQLQAARVNKKGSIIEVRVVSPDQTFSKLMAERVVAQTKQLYISVKTGYMAANVAKLEAKADSIVAMANRRSYQTAGLQVLNANEAYRTAEVPAELSQRDRLVNNTLYAEILKNLETARMALASQTPVIQLLDTPVYPLQDKRWSLFQLLFSAMAASTALYVLLAFFRYPGNSGKK